MLNRNKETQRLQTIVDEQAEQIDSLLKTVEALVVACEQAAIDEREACADLVFEMAQLPKYEKLWLPLHHAQSAIRARGAT